ncbi:uncharacterized protein LOC101901679 isoform X2 [Musca domestica]|uniref:Uncharacterized protein LOC101901679 isoform X2 n=1 Tax=Musca domestica TaxID=7370 RepID=A0ABM3UTG3_MUSDO|nr:uncharacterized protein LOC101901679 isoform X2 [Musca domestica]
MGNKILFHTFVFYVLIISNVAWAQNCQLSEANMRRDFIFIHKNDILRTDYIPDGDSLTLYCNERTQPVDLTCSRGVLQAMPAGAACTDRLKLTVQATKKPCSASGVSGELYDMVYKWSTGHSITLYSICYSTQRETVLYSTHRTYGFNLATPIYNQRLRPTFKQLGHMNGARVKSFEADDIYQRFNTLLGPQQTYIKSNRDFALQRGHMANSQDFLTYDQMDATFLYMNVVPMARGCNIRNWKHVENWIHKLPSATTYATVLSGTHDVQYLQHSQTHRFVPIYLMAGEKNPMPMWLYKVVKYNNRCHVFVTLNDHSKNPAIRATNICQPTQCPQGISFSSDPEACISFCCDYSEFVKQVGNHAKLC